MGHGTEPCTREATEEVVENVADEGNGDGRKEPASGDRPRLKRK